MPFSVCILDLDHFKRINDRFGHIAGDGVLTSFADKARSELRGLDLMGRNNSGAWFGRYGGEEFIIVLPNTSLLGARNCAERIRHITSDTSFDDVLRITVSVGVTEYRIGEDVEDTLRRADQALYNAKNGGRNQIVCAGDMGNTHVPSDFGSQIVIGLFGKAN
jgi:diguanylate cyclase (GGDEF)-like protein